jgi:hypothetical protein
MDCSFLLAFKLFKTLFQTVQSGFPGLTLRRQPIYSKVKRSDLKLTKSPLCLNSSSNELGTLQDIQVLGHSGQRDLKWFRKFSDCRFTLAQTTQDRSPSRMSQCVEDGIKIRFSFNHMVKLAADLHL